MDLLTVEDYPPRNQREKIPWKVFTEVADDLLGLAAHTAYRLLEFDPVEIDPGNCSCINQGEEKQYKLELAVTNIAEYLQDSLDANTLLGEYFRAIAKLVREPEYDQMALALCAAAVDEGSCKNHKHDSPKDLWKKGSGKDGKENAEKSGEEQKVDDK
jgi:hypothetical protein